MEKLLEEAIETQKEFDHHTKEAKRLGPKRNKQIVQLSKKLTKAEIAKHLGLTSQRIIQILRKEKGEEKGASAQAAKS